MNEKTYQCVGICIFDTVTGCCLGCGRPPLPTPDNNLTVDEKPEIKVPVS